MTTTEVQAAVERVRIYAYEEGDDEAATSEEQRLYKSLLKAAANGENIQEQAALALKTEKFTFRRY